MEFGIFDHVDRGAEPLDEYFENRMKAVEAFDRGGFYSYHVAEHHATPLGMAASPSVYLAAVAQRTRRLRFGPMVFALPLHHPIRLVEEICMLDQMSRGRLELGFGRGASPIETRYFGPDPDQAQQMYVEGLELVMNALGEGKVDFRGEYFAFENVPLAMEPYQRPYPPLWYGMHSPNSAERAARRGMNVISLDTPAETRAMADRYRATWREVGGGRPCPRIGLSTFIVVGETDRAALASARRAYEMWHESFNFLFEMHGVRPNLPRPKTFDGMVETRRAVAGTAETVTGTLRDYLAESGADYMIGQFAFGDLTPAETLGSIGLFVERVMPAISVWAAGPAGRAAMAPAAS